ncbi:MAG: hypothetical protein ACQEV7_10735 [Bacillota bacterium]|jgi:hypothetical protein
MELFFYTVVTVIIIYIPMFYRLNRTLRKLEDRIVDLETKWETRNVVPLQKKK